MKQVQQTEKKMTGNLFFFAYFQSSYYGFD